MAEALKLIRVRARSNRRIVEQRVELDSVRYTLRTRWSKWDGLWYLDISDDAGNALVTGIRLVLGIDLLWPYKHRAIPQGQLFMLDTATDRTFVEAGLDDVDTRVMLLYRPAAEVAA